MWTDYLSLPFIVNIYSFLFFPLNKATLGDHKSLTTCPICSSLPKDCLLSGCPYIYLLPPRLTIWEQDCPLVWLIVVPKAHSSGHYEPSVQSWIDWSPSFWPVISMLGLSLPSPSKRLSFIEKQNLFWIHGHLAYLSFFFKFYLFIYPFMAVLGLRFCARAFSSCGKWGPLFIAVRGTLTIAASLVAEHRLQTRRLSNCGSRA